MPRSDLRSLPHLFCCGLVAAILAGCQNQPASVSKNGSKAAATGDTDAPPADPATDMLSSAVFQLQPENLGIDSDAKAAVSVLNAWREQTGLIEADQFGFTEQDLKSLPTSLLSDAARQRVFATEFSPGDAFYIRNALLASTMSKNAAKGNDAELDRIVAMFNYTMRTVTLLPAVVPQLPFPMYEILLLGQGTPDDRAWVFAALLKQQRIDAVLLQSRDDPEARLVGALLDGEVYLFDTRLGLPIPNGDEPASARITRPATFREMTAHPEWWQPLTVRVDQPYPWTSEMLADAEVSVISNEESWGGRMKQLESVLPADSLCVLYDPLVETSALKSLPRRIADANPDWTADKLHLWNHAADIQESLADLGQKAQQLQVILQRFNMPLEVVEVEREIVNPQNQQKERVKVAELKPSRQHLKCRTEQLQGKYAAATSHFLGIRHLAVEGPPPELRGNPQAFQQVAQIYALAASDASFWSAVCKWESGDVKTAVGTLRDYLKKYRESDWTSAARMLVALGEAELGNLSEARSAIAEMPPDDPHRRGLDVLQKRWADLPQDESPESKDESPEPNE